MKRRLFPRRRHRGHALAAAPRPVLRFSPTAWAKLLYLRDRGDTEIGGFGIAGPEQLLRVTDIGVVSQVCSPMTVEFDDTAVAEFFDAQIDVGRKVESFARVWIHTHPGDSPLPSGTDEDTFARVFGPCDWAVMFILDRGGQTYARLQWNVGPRGALQIPVEVDFAAPFVGSDHAQWEAEYQSCVVTNWFDPLSEPFVMADRRPLFKELACDTACFTP